MFITVDSYLEDQRTGRITDADRVGTNDIAVVYARSFERRAREQLQADIDAGRVPDWLEWSAQMATVPL